MMQAGELLDLDFEVKAALGGEKRTMAFRELIAGPTIVSVYMRNNTGSCDKQLISLSEHFEAIQAAGYSVVGVSRDTVGSHLKYAAKHSIRFPLISDPEYGFARATDSLVEKKMYGKAFTGPTRSAYLISPDGRLQAVCEKVDPANHGEQLRALIDSLKAL